MDHKGGAPKNWCLKTVVLEKTLENPLDSKEIKPVNAKGWLGMDLPDLLWVVRALTHTVTSDLSA